MLAPYPTIIALVGQQDDNGDTDHDDDGGDDDDDDDDDDPNLGRVTHPLAPRVVVPVGCRGLGATQTQISVSCDA